MRFIVEVFRVLVIGLLALLLVGAAFAGFTLAMGGFALEPRAAWQLAAAAAGAVFALGLLATLIAIHDRLSEIARPFSDKANGDEPPPDPDGEP